MPDAGDEGEKQTFVQFYLRVLTARIDLRRNDCRRAACT